MPPRSHGNMCARTVMWDPSLLVPWAEWINDLPQHKQHKSSGTHAASMMHLHVCVPSPSWFQRPRNLQSLFKHLVVYPPYCIFFYLHLLVQANLAAEKLGRLFKPELIKSLASVCRHIWEKTSCGWRLRKHSQKSNQSFLTLWTDVTLSTNTSLRITKKHITTHRRLIGRPWRAVSAASFPF